MARDVGREQAAFFRQENELPCPDRRELVMGKSNGTCVSIGGRSISVDIETKVPCTEILCIRPIGDKTWFGTPRGAFAMNRDGTIDYYASNRWLVDDAVIDIAPGPDGSVLILSKTGLSIIHFEPMTLAGKAEHFDKLTRRRTFAMAFKQRVRHERAGRPSTGPLIDEDNDGALDVDVLARAVSLRVPDRMSVRNCYESSSHGRLTESTPMRAFPLLLDRACYQVATAGAGNGGDHMGLRRPPGRDRGHFFVYAIFAEIVPDRAGATGRAAD